MLNERESLTTIILYGTGVFSSGGSWLLCVLIVHRSNRKNEQFKQYDKINNYALADFGRYIIATIPENPTLDRSMLM